MRLILLLSMITSLLCSCEKTATTAGVEGKFKNLSGLEGCNWMIETDGGTLLEPTNLSEFDIAPVNGMAVRVDLTKTGYFSVCLDAEIVDLYDIEPL